MRASLVGESDAVPEGVRAARGAGASAACRRCMRWICWKPSAATVTKLRYRDWDDLIDYCRYSAMPVGRFVLDVHGESQSTVARQ